MTLPAGYVEKVAAFEKTSAWANEANTAVLIAQKFGLSVGDHVFDFACGAGGLCPLIVGRKMQYTGYDISYEMMRYAIDQYGPFRFTDGRLPGRKEFDAVFCVHALPHFKYPNEFFHQVKMLLKKSGLLVLIVYNDVHRICWEPVNLFNSYKHDPTIVTNYKRCDVEKLIQSFHRYDIVHSSYVGPLPWGIKRGPSVIRRSVLVVARRIA